MKQKAKPRTAKARHAALLRSVTELEYTALLVAQGGHCAICTNTGKTRRLHVDHDHKTMQIRGLLCHRCNRGLPFFGDDPARLRAAADYLERSAVSVASDSCLECGRDLHGYKSYARGSWAGDIRLCRYCDGTAE